MSPLQKILGFVLLPELIDEIESSLGFYVAQNISFTIDLKGEEKILEIPMKPGYYLLNIFPKNSQDQVIIQTDNHLINSYEYQILAQFRFGSVKKIRSQWVPKLTNLTINYIMVGPNGIIVQLNPFKGYIGKAGTFVAPGARAQIIPSENLSQYIQLKNSGVLGLCEIGTFRGLIFLGTETKPYLNLRFNYGFGYLPYVTDISPDLFERKNNFKFGLHLL